MSQLLALSLDCLSSPSIQLKLASPDSARHESFGRGFAWYNYDELSTTEIKETKYTADMASSFNNNMQDLAKFHSTIFIGHIRGAAKRLVLKDTQPFIRTYAGRDWIFVHSGDLMGPYKISLPLSKNAFFEPIGSTDSEYMFCYLLEKIKASGARCLADVGWKKIYHWLAHANKLGTMNVMISDGQDMLVYHDHQAFNPLYWLRSCPPHSSTCFDTTLFSVNFISPFDINHTFILISNQNIHQQFTQMFPGQLLVLRRGQVIWNEQPPIKRVNATTATVKLPPVPNDGTQNQLFNEIKNNIPLAETFTIPDYVGTSARRFYSVTHETLYRYDNQVNMSKHLFRLHPVSDHIQTVLDYKLSISVPGYGEFFEDVFGNIAAFYQINAPYDALLIRSESIVSMVDNPSQRSETLHYRRDIPLAWLPWQRQMMSPYLLPPELPESELNELIEFAMSFVKRNDYDLMEVLNDINQTIYRDFQYVSGATSITTTPYQLYLNRRGVCQDFTNLFICLARLINVPARYRAGYIHTAADYSNQIQSEASHAWVELYLPSIGWYGFDPTNGCVANRNHVRVASGRNYIDAAPTSGTIFQGGGREELFTKVEVKEIDQYTIEKFA